MTRAKHTRGRLFASVLRTHGADRKMDGCDIGSDDGTNVALAFYRDIEHDRGETIANARRLAAAWNACDGVPIEVLEANASGGLPWLVSDQIDARVARGRLVEVLARLHDWAQAQAPDTHFGGDHPIALAREALRGHAPTTLQGDPPQFPAMLRKMWSGGDVLAWIYSNWPRGGAAS
jgi:hypothetical protein